MAGEKGNHAVGQIVFAQKVCPHYTLVVRISTWQNRNEEIIIKNICSVTFIISIGRSVRKGLNMSTVDVTIIYSVYSGLKQRRAQCILCTSTIYCSLRCSTLRWIKISTLLSARINISGKPGNQVNDNMHSAHTAPVVCHSPWRCVTVYKYMCCSQLKRKQQQTGQRFKPLWRMARRFGKKIRRG